MMTKEFTWNITHHTFINENIKKVIDDNSGLGWSKQIGKVFDGTTDPASVEPRWGRSVAAVAVAAHEVSHALQHSRGEQAFALRFRLVKNLGWIDRAASATLLLAPVVFILVRSPALVAVQIVAGVLLLGFRVFVHVVTLPVELDASFAKALPVLARDGYLSVADLPAARSVLRAAAWTYVAAALATLLDVARWFRLLRF